MKEPVGSLQHPSLEFALGAKYGAASSPPRRRAETLRGKNDFRSRRSATPTAFTFALARKVRRRESVGWAAKPSALRQRSSESVGWAAKPSAFGPSMQRTSQERNVPC